MTISRRDFLANSVCAASAAALAAGWGGARNGIAMSPAHGALECALLDSMYDCALEESVRGYELALGEAGRQFRPMSFEELPAARLLIVPGVVKVERQTSRTWQDMVERGATIILESGAGFVDPPGFRAHRRWLEEFCGVLVEPPVDLWAEKSAYGRIPYVHYAWPRPVMVRDFSRVVPVSPAAGEVIARVDGRPVALRRTTGRGMVVFLGSPLGPALYAGDREARGWLSELLAAG